MNLVSKGFIATATDISNLTHSLLNADRTAVEGRTTYLKALVATTINELGVKARKHAGKAPKLNAESISVQVGALAAVHERFYAAVLEVASKGIGNGRGQKKELNRRTNFARTSLSAVRAYVRAGHDLTYVIVAKVTKSSLAVDRPRRALSAGQLSRQLDARSKGLIATILAIGREDPVAALTAVEALVNAVALEIKGVPPVTLIPAPPLQRVSQTLHAAAQQAAA